MTIAPNLARMGPLETRHPKLSVHIKSRENSLERPPNSCMNVIPLVEKKTKNADRALTKWIRMELALVYQATPMLATPLKGWLALVYHGTPMLASYSFIFCYKYPPPPHSWKNHEGRDKKKR